ncbi:hypothetical protein CERSUDRAFT_112040 [Gelatoporia subvermispora B]|uniref:Heme oxygenase n=1 Tax=Ceriporiopsis subvermispora (strain B) TaxID=914234 RepID=M2R596_CERS8|nr:hypothetical protein CERSUDRAFT_112040 [Gelatoporia subvermispora B]
MATDSSPALDLSQPMATLLRLGTAQAHEKAEHSKGAAWLTRGELDRDEYIRFLMMLYHVYSALERALDRHAAHPVLAPTYNPALLARAPSLAADIAFLLQASSDWQAHPLHTELLAHPPPTFAQYVARLDELAEADPAPLLAHAYVRYLGDLSGGQFIRRRLAKAYGLEDGRGLSFYDFAPLGAANAGGATIGDMKKIKEWYRDGMNAGAGDNAAAKDAILREAGLAFDLNTGLFDTLRPPTSLSTPDSVAVTSVESTKAGQLRDPHEAVYRQFSVLSLIAALILAHYFLASRGMSVEDCLVWRVEALKPWLSS